MKNKLQIGLLALSVLLIAFVLALPFFDRLVLETRNHEILKSYNLKEGDYFDIKFRHSVNKGLIIERYMLNKKDGLIFLEYGWFENYGAGMMDTIDESMKMEQDGEMLKITFPKKEIKSVKFASAGIANHIFIYGDEEFNLFENCPYKTIDIGIKKLSLLEIIKSF
ncbi:MAG: DUF1850 domain-containing protein [Proteocatella sp.]